MFFTVGYQQLGGAFPLPVLPFGVQRYGGKAEHGSKSDAVCPFAAKAVRKRVKSGARTGKIPIFE